MAVKGDNFDERMMRLSRAYKRATDPQRKRKIHLAFNRLLDRVTAGGWE